MRIVRFTWIALLLTVAAHPAFAQGWSLGTNFGVAVAFPQGGPENLFLVGLPGNVGPLVPGFQPGLRVGILGTEGEIYLDAGLATLSTSGETASGYQIGVNVQLNSSPYLTGGLGFLGMSVLGEHLTNTVVGAGLGVANKVAEGHGRLRAELRLDYVLENTQGLDSTPVFGIKVGFDLLMGKP